MKSVYDKLATDMFNGEHPEAEGTANLMYTEVVLEDCYLIKQFSQKGIKLNTIVDIGANTGLFTLLAHSLYPETQIFAIEPFLDTYKHLNKNTRGLNKVTVQNFAYGKGEPIELINAEYAGCNYCKPRGDSTLYSIPLHNNLSTLIETPYMIKSDCEGGELAFFEGDDFDIVKNAEIIAMETHFDKYPQSKFVDFMFKIKQTHDILVFKPKPNGINADFVAVKKEYKLSISSKMEISAYVSTVGRFDTTLPSTLISLAMQSLPPREIIIYDDSTEHKDLRQHPMYQYIFGMLDAKGIQWRVLFGEGKGQVKNHERVLKEAKYRYIYRCDDDVILEPNVLELLSKQMTGGVGAVGGLVLHSNRPIERIPSYYSYNKIEDIYTEDIQCCQWYKHPDNTIKSVDHIYSTFLLDRESVIKIGGYNKELSRVGFREETIMTYSLKHAGYQLLIVPDAVCWHYRWSNGGIRTETKQQDYLHDELIFAGKIQEWGIKPNRYKWMVSGKGMGDDLILLQVLRELKPKYPEYKWIIATCYLQVFEDEADVIIASIDDAHHKFGDEINQFDSYDLANRLNWKGSMLDIYRKIYE